MMSYQRAELERKRRLNAGARAFDGGSTDLTVAAHEGGHVIVGRLLDFDPFYATIDSGLGSDGLTSFNRGSVGPSSSREQAFNHAIVRLSGVEGEKLAGYDGSGKDDLLQARAALGRINQSREVVDVLVDLARRQARRLLEENFLTLLKITSALLERRTLDQGAIEKLLASSTPDDADDDADEFHRVYVPPPELIFHGVPERIVR
jgi:ATP-dependent Zn protease